MNLVSYRKFKGRQRETHESELGVSPVCGRRVTVARWAFSYYHVDLIAELPDVEVFLEATRQQFDAAELPTST